MKKRLKSSSKLVLFLIIGILIFAVGVSIFGNMNKGEVKMEPGEDLPHYGYIIKLKETPLIVKDTEAQKQLKSTNEIKNIISVQKVNLDKEHENFKNNLKIKLGKSEKDLKILNEYKKVFNGFALDITAEEAEKLKSLPEVESVSLNLEVNATLMDSVPLINADDVWSMQDSNGLNVTGKNVSIAIIDTGVDYTHPDLGGTRIEIPEYDFLKKVNGNVSLASAFNEPFHQSMYVRGNKVYFRSGMDGQIYSYDYNTQIVSKITPNNYFYYNFYIYNNTLVSIVSNKTSGQVALIETDLNGNEGRILLPFREFLQFYGRMSNGYLVFTTDSYTTPGYFNIYVYDFSNKELITIDNGGEGGQGVVNNGNVYYLRYTGGVDHLKVYDLETQQHLENMAIGFTGLPLDSFENEIIVSNLDAGGYTLFNTQTREEVINITTPSEFSQPISNDYTTKGFFITGTPEELARFNQQIVVFEDFAQSNKFLIYDRLNNKFVSFLGLFYSEKEIELDGNRICFSVLNGGDVYCFDYDSNYNYFIPPFNIFNSKVVGGYNFISNNHNDPIDDMGHGTHVASIAAGNGDWNKNGIIEQGEGLNGVAPDAKIYAYKVLDSGGGGPINGIIAAIEMAIDPNNDNDFSDHLNVISMSLGGYPANPDDYMSTTIDNAVDAGVVAVIAAGNCGPEGSLAQCPRVGDETISSPGTARKAITVGATNKSDKIAGFSSRGPVRWIDGQGNEQSIIKPDVVAPGRIICAAQYDSAWDSYKCYDNQHVAISGTSMATPMVAGAVALIKQAHPDWSPQQIKDALMNTAVDLGYDENIQGAGRIDIKQAINYPCGNNIIDAGETCDGTNLNNKTCATASNGQYNLGTLSCKSDCSGFNFSSCSSVSCKGFCGSGFSDAVFDDNQGCYFSETCLCYCDYLGLVYGDSCGDYQAQCQNEIVGWNYKMSDWKINVLNSSNSVVPADARNYGNISLSIKLVSNGTRRVRADVWKDDNNLSAKMKIKIKYKTSADYTWGAYYKIFFKNFNGTSLSTDSIIKLTNTNNTVQIIEKEISVPKSAVKIYASYLDFEAGKNNKGTVEIYGASFEKN